jgi:hypothetical protein
LPLTETALAFSVADGTVKSSVALVKNPGSILTGSTDPAAATEPCKCNHKLTTAEGHAKFRFFWINLFQSCHIKQLPLS